MLVLTFLFILAILCQNSFAEQEKITRLSIYHQKNGNFIRRGEIVGLPGVPQYVSADNEITEFNDPKEIFYQIKVKDENTGNIHLSSVKLCQMVASDWNDEFILHLDENNDFYHLDYYSTAKDCEEKVKFPISTKPFTTSMKVVKANKGPKPLLGNFESQAKKQQQSSKKPAADINDQAPQFKEVEEKSFFQKYW
ncbi:hypothetical protein G6F37_001727 [Rhizopus arrhizus]|nr:hypothetical protein G6F38_000784 [Rhizopus arrhizus]KAG1162889.1 hypothetical protein G6F37_001727 [Rhizopus arrhizus]